MNDETFSQELMISMKSTRENEKCNKLKSIS
jgi:hypothetical protein